MTEERLKELCEWPPDEESVKEMEAEIRRCWAEIKRLEEVHKLMVDKDELWDEAKEILNDWSDDEEEARLDRRDRARDMNEEFRHD